MAVADDLPAGLGPIPTWVRWLAQDRDGGWWGYEYAPLQHHAGWYENELGRVLCLGRGRPNPGWRDSLRGLGSRD